MNATLIVSLWFLRMSVVCEIKTFLIINELLAHRSTFCCSQQRHAEPIGSVVDSMVYRLVWRLGGVFSHRQLFRVVLPTRRSTSDSALCATCWDVKYNRSYGDPAAALSSIRPTFLRFRQLQRNRRQDVRREVGHLCDFSADPQADGAGASVGNLGKAHPFDKDARFNTTDGRQSIAENRSRDPFIKVANKFDVEEDWSRKKRSCSGRRRCNCTNIVTGMIICVSFLLGEIVLLLSC